MTNYVRYLCVGGNNAGNYFTAADNLYHVRIATPPECAFLSPRDVDLNKTTITYDTYQRQEWSTPQGKIFFWVPVDQTPMETMKLLIEEYMK